MLEEQGQLSAAEALLTRLRSHVKRPRDSVIVNARLARLLLSEGRRNDADAVASWAITTAVSAEYDTFSLIEAESLLGDIALDSGELGAAEIALRRSIVRFRALLSEPDRELACASLARTLVTLSYCKGHSGLYADGHRLASEAQHQVRALNRPNYSLEFATRAALSASSSCLWSDASAVEEEARSCYTTSIAQGRMKSAVDSAMYLSMIYRFSDQGSKAEELLSSLLPIVRGFSACQSKAIFFVTTANLLSERHQERAAASMLREAQLSAPPGQPIFEAQLRLAAARAEFSRAAYAQAVESADEAAALFSRIDRIALIGVCKQIEGQAWGKMHQVRKAIACTRDSVAAFSQAGHPVLLQRSSYALNRLLRR
jgi:hypothetical protein